MLRLRRGTRRQPLFDDTGDDSANGWPGLGPFGPWFVNPLAITFRTPDALDCTVTVHCPFASVPGAVSHVFDDERDVADGEAGLGREVEVEQRAGQRREVDAVGARRRRQRERVLTADRVDRRAADADVERGERVRRPCR